MNTSLLNAMLANACPILSKGTELKFFRINLHCIDVVIIARRLSVETYDVVSFKMAPDWAKTSELDIYKEWERLTVAA